MRSPRWMPAAAFAAVDRVVQTGQDPRRFVEDLLERLRDLIVVAATRDGAASVLRGVPQDELDRMATQAAAFGAAELSRAADVVNTSLTEMTGATSPRLHLELMVARLLVPASDDSERGALARVERLERRVGMRRRRMRPSPSRRRARRARSAATADAPAPRPASRVPASTPNRRPTARAPINRGRAPSRRATPVTAAQLRDAWPEVLEVGAEGRRRTAVGGRLAPRRVHAFDGEVLTLGFTNENDVASFQASAGRTGRERQRAAPAAILDVLGRAGQVPAAGRCDAATTARRRRRRPKPPAESAPPSLAAPAGLERHRRSPAAEPAAPIAEPRRRSPPLSRRPRPEPSSAPEPGEPAHRGSACRGRRHASRARPHRRATARRSCASCSAPTSSRSSRSHRATARDARADADAEPRRRASSPCTRESSRS